MVVSGGTRLSRGEVNKIISKPQTKTKFEVWRGWGRKRGLSTED